MKFIITVRSEGHEPWEEHYNVSEIKTLEQAQSWAKAVILNYNLSLRPGERERELVAVVEGGNGKFYRDDCPHCHATGLADPECSACEGNGCVDDPSDGGTMTCPVCDAEPCPHCK